VMRLSRSHRRIVGLILAPHQVLSPAHSYVQAWSLPRPFIFFSRPLPLPHPL
jgi:hypothetical protein